MSAFALATGAGVPPDSGPAPSVVLPDSAIASADRELAVLRALAKSGARVRVLPARWRELHEAFAGGDFDLLHLACHGRFGGPAAADASCVRMEDGDFSAAQLDPGLETVLRRRRPLIFFNSCESGQVGFSLTGLGSWGARLVELGCGAFVGTLWQVRDEGAVAFAGAFYQGLVAERLPLGEAVRRARDEVRRRWPNDPTWLAYCCFGDPLAGLGPLGPPAHPRPGRGRRLLHWCLAALRRFRAGKRSPGPARRSP